MIRVRLPLDHRPIATISSPRLGTAGGSDHSPVPFDYCQIVGPACFRHAGLVLHQAPAQDHDHHVKIGLLAALRCAAPRCLPGQPRNCAAPSVQRFTLWPLAIVATRPPFAVDIASTIDYTVVDGSEITNTREVRPRGGSPPQFVCRIAPRPLSLGGSQPARGRSGSGLREIGNPPSCRLPPIHRA